MKIVKPRTVAALISAAMAAGAFTADAELYTLASHTLITPDGHVTTQVRGDFEANGTLLLEKGRLEVRISIAMPENGYRDEQHGIGFFTIGDQGVVVTVTYDDGRTHSGVVILSDPLVILVGLNGYSEVNVWKPANAFLRNQ